MIFLPNLDSTGRVVYYTDTPPFFLTLFSPLLEKNLYVVYRHPSTNYSHLHISVQLVKKGNII